MVERSDFSGKSFAELEHAGWERAAPFYHGLAGVVTDGVAEPFLDAASVGPKPSTVAPVTSAPMTGQREARVR